MEHLEPVIQRRRTGLGRVAVTPGGSSEPPADLDRRREWRLERRCREAGEPEERSIVPTLDRPQPEAVRVPVILNPRQEQV